MIDPNSLKVTELKAELTARGLPTKGVKKDLVARLEEALANDGITTGSATEPDVAPKDTDMDLPTNNNKDDHASGSEQRSPTTQEEAKEIAQIAPPVAKPVAAPAETDIVMVPAPVPAPAPSTKPVSSIEGVQVSAAAAITPDPAVRISTLSQEGLIDTTMNNALPADQSTESKKRSLDADDTTTASSSSNGDSTSGTKETPAKKQKAIEINRDGNEQIIAAAKESLEADARRRSAAPSPSPAPPAHPGRTLSTSTIATVAEVTTSPAAATDSEAADSVTSGSPSGPRSPSDDKKVGGTERRDVRSQFQRSIQLAAQDRKAEATSKSSIVSPITTSASVVLPEPASVKADPNPSTKRALTITNFVRPLVISQVKRMLSEYGEIETLWLDSIKTHCYVIFKEAAEAEKAYNRTNDVVFPQETGKPLKPYFITAEAARNSIAAAELAQKAGKKPVIYTGKEHVVLAAPAAAERPRAEATSKTPIVVQRDTAGVIFKRPQVQVQVVQPTELFNMTKAKPMLYYKAVKEPPAPAAPKATNVLAPEVAEAN
ncbi:Apoptotic chromatin condensation inducer in the nucleus [Haplosporangium gracile]|nr:Apoptotic chromatin condensation inducer in the nucleus [Haplosporangium gracile]